jgi:hypothetical protein
MKTIEDEDILVVTPDDEDILVGETPTSSS